MAFRQPEIPADPSSIMDEAQLVQQDEDTMASLDLFIETLQSVSGCELGLLFNYYFMDVSYDGSFCLLVFNIYID